MLHHLKTLKTFQDSVDSPWAAVWLQGAATWAAIPVVNAAWLASIREHRHAAMGASKKMRVEEEQDREVLIPSCVVAERCQLLVAAPTNAGSACTKPGCDVCVGIGKHNVILIINYLETRYRSSCRSLIQEGGLFIYLFIKTLLQSGSLSASQWELH